MEKYGNFEKRKVKVTRKNEYILAKIGVDTAIPFENGVPSVFEGTSDSIPFHSIPFRERAIHPSENEPSLVSSFIPTEAI